MNCKPGDLAIICKAPRDGQEHLGKVVCCAWLEKFKGLLYWHFDPPLIDSEGDQAAFADECLRPIRDNPGEDEMLRIVGKPSELTV